MKPTYRTIEYKSALPAQTRLNDLPSNEQLHWHKEPELIYVAQGSLTVVAGDRQHRLKSGEVFIINSDEIHRILGARAKYLSVHLSYGFIRRFDSTVGQYDFCIDPAAQAYLETVAIAKKLTLSELGTGDEYVPLEQYSLIIRLLRLLLTRCKRQKQLSRYGSEAEPEYRAKLLADFIESRYRTKLSQAEAAQLVGLTRESFSAKFRQLFGVCFRDYLTDVRTRHAVEDLLKSGVSVEDAALRNGFGNMNAFANACKRIYGVTPLQLKKQGGAVPMDKTA